MDYSLRRGSREYVLHGSGTRWHLRIWWGDESIRFPLDYDRRHRRLFLSERDEQFVGVEGITALEKLARYALGPPKSLR